MGARSVDVRITGSNASLKRSIAESERSVKGMGAAVKETNAAIRSVGVGLAGLGGYAVLRGLKGALDAAGDFQQKLQVLRAVSNGTSSDLKLASDTAIKLGKDLRLPTTTAQGAADAMLELAKGGLKVKQAVGAAHATLLLSTAANLDNASSAKAVVAAMKTFGLQAKATTKIVDDFAGAANASIADITDVTDAMMFAGTGFKALGVPVGDAATAIAEMANAGQKGGVAGAALNVAFTKLANPTKRAGNLMNDLGIKVFDAHGNFVGIRGAIENMTPILDKMSQQQRLATLAILGGTRGMRALNIVLGGGVEQWDKLHKNVTRAGQAQQLANAQTAGYKGAVAALTSSLQTLQLQLGLALLPTATRFTRWLNVELPTAIRVSSAAMSAWVLVLKANFALIKGLISGVSDLLHGRWGAAWNDAKNAVTTFAAPVVQTIKALGPKIVSSLEQAAKGAYTAALHVGENIAKGALEGVVGLPGKLARALIPGGAGTKYLPGSNGGTKSPRQKAGGGIVAGRYSDGDIHPHMLSGEEAVLNPLQIEMVGRDKVMSALSATGAPTYGAGFAAGKKPARSYGGRVYPTGKALTPAQLVSNALNARGDTWGLNEAKAQLRITQASAAGDANGNVSAYLNDANVETNQIRAIQAILANPAKALGVKGAQLTKQQRTNLIGALSSAIQQRQQDYSTVYDLQHPAAADGSGGDTSGGDGFSSDPGTISADAQAQIDQLNAKLGIANRSAGIANAAVGVFGGPGDIGEGGFRNGWEAAQGSPNINIYTLHPGDPKTLSAIGAAATGGMALQPFITSPRISVNV